MFVRTLLLSLLVLICSTAMSFGQIGVDVNVQVEVKDLKQILETLDRFRAMAGDNGGSREADRPAEEGYVGPDRSGGEGGRPSRTESRSGFY